MLTHLTGFFPEDYFSAPKWRWLLKFLRALDTAHGLLAHTTNRLGGPPKILRVNRMIGFKIPHMRTYNFGSSEHNLTKFYEGMWLIVMVITWSLILQGVPLTKFGRVKTFKIQRNL